jgi:hypothetical protein
MERQSRITLSVILLSAVYLGSSLAAPLPPNPKPYTGKALAPTYLRCEYRVDPLGIDEPAPRLSWIVESGLRGQRQTACRLLVASSEKLLGKDQGDLWDTGKVARDETIGTAYQGQPLVSQQRCFWKVKVWDKDGRESAWSKPALWSMGLLQPGDWKAEWIGYDKPRQKPFSRRPARPRLSGFGTRRTSRARCRNASASSTTRSPCRRTRR